MNIFKINIRISAFLMAVVIFIFSLISPMSVDAKGGRDLYGTGSANDMNIVKLLDMALNRGGMSMSPSTIQSFLEYWWDTVAADLNTCISNVDTSITGTQAFVDAVNAALESSEHYDKLGDIIKKYLNFCLTMEYKSLSDFKTLLTQESTFRKFLLSYVTDEDGNIVGTVDNKLKKYNLKNELVNMVRQAADAYIEEYEGYYLVKTFTINDLRPADFTKKESYDIACDFLKNYLGDELILFRGGSLSDKCFTYVLLMDGLSLVNTSYSQLNNSLLSVNLYNDNWQQQNALYWDLLTTTSSYYYKNFPDTTDCPFYRVYTNRYDIYFNNPHLISNCMSLFTKDGRVVKVWKSLDAFKNYTAGKSDIYYSSNYSNYDYTVDNSVSFDYDYYTSNNYSHTTIQNNIDNSTEVNETTINNIVNNYITNNYYGDGSGGGGGEGSGGSGNWFTDLIKGIPELLAALIDGLAGMVDSIAGLFGSIVDAMYGALEKLIDLIVGLFKPSEESINALKEKTETKFAFISTAHEQISGVAERFDTMGSKSPTITFPLSKTPLVDYGVGDITVSFEWFEPYRYGFHSLLSAIMWIMFLFNQYFSIKNLIQGTSSFAGSLSEPEPEHNPIGFLW